MREFSKLLQSMEHRPKDGSPVSQAGSKFRIWNNFAKISKLKKNSESVYGSTVPVPTLPTVGTGTYILWDQDKLFDKKAWDKKISWHFSFKCIPKLLPLVDRYGTVPVPTYRTLSLTSNFLKLNSQVSLASMAVQKNQISISCPFNTAVHVSMQFYPVWIGKLSSLTYCAQ